MPDLLIVSRDPDVCDTVAKLGVESGLRSKFVHNIAQGEQWIETRRLAAVLVDASFEVEEYQRISESLWKTAPMALLGIFDLNESVERTWDYALLGLEIFDGPNVLELLGRSLRLVARTSVGDDDSISILVVEDLDSPRDIICTYVENMGFTVHGAVSYTHLTLPTI